MILPIAQLAKLLPLLGSNQVGEQLATLDAINKILKKEEADWHDVVKAINEAPTWESQPRQTSQNDTWNDIDSGDKSDWERLPIRSKLNWINALLNFTTDRWQQGFLSDQRDRLEQYKERTRFSPKQVAVIERMIKEYEEKQK